MADVLDTLLSARPYKEAWELGRALDYVRDQRGLHFDPGCVDALLRNEARVIGSAHAIRRPRRVRIPPERIGSDMSALIQGIRERLRRRQDSEHQQILLRLVITLLFLVYTASSACRKC